VVDDRPARGLTARRLRRVVDADRRRRASRRRAGSALAGDGPRRAPDRHADERGLRGHDARSLRADVAARSAGRRPRPGHHAAQTGKHATRPGQAAVRRKRRTARPEHHTARAGKHATRPGQAAVGRRRPRVRSDLDRVERRLGVRFVRNRNGQRRIGRRPRAERPGRVARRLRLRAGARRRRARLLTPAHGRAPPRTQASNLAPTAAFLCTGSSTGRERSSHRGPAPDAGPQQSAGWPVSNSLPRPVARRRCREPDRDVQL